MAFLSDTFTGADGDLTAHTGETGATWTEHSSFTSGAHRIQSNRLRASSTTSGSAYYASGVPASADYDVEAPAHVLSAGGRPAIAARMDISADTMYALDWQGSNGILHLYKRVASVSTQLDSSNQSALVNIGETHTIKLEVRGDQIKGYIDGTEVCTATDSEITAAGRAGVHAVSSSAATAGIHLESITAADAPAASERAAAVGATGTIASAGLAWSILERSASVGGTGALSSIGQRDLLRSAAVAASGTVATSGGVSGVQERSAAIGATAAIQVVGQCELLRSALIVASGSVASAGSIQGVRERASLISAASGIESAGAIAQILECAAALSATAGISAAGTVLGSDEYERSASLAAVGLIVTRYDQWLASTDTDWAHEEGSAWAQDTDTEWITT